MFLIIRLCQKFKFRHWTRWLQHFLWSFIFLFFITVVKIQLAYIVHNQSSLMVIHMTDLDLWDWPWPLRLTLATLNSHSCLAVSAFSHSSQYSLSAFLSSFLIWSHFFSICGNNNTYYILYTGILFLPRLIFALLKR